MDKILADALRAHPDITVTGLSRLNCCRPGLLPAFLQDGRDVHGSHGLFYWLRARQRGLVVSQERAGVVLAWRPDVGRLVALRPVGDASAAADLLDTVLKVTSAALPGLQLVARYCGDTLAPVLLGRGWHDFGSGWCPQAPLDDEAFPEVVITADPDDIPRGKGCKSLRGAITWDQGAYRFQARYRPRGGEAFPEVVITADPDDIPRGKGCKSLREAITWRQGAYRFQASSRPRGGEAETMTRSAAQIGRASCRER